ncbi:MAG: hypothetical protein RLZZ267_1502 [Bacillota bacterium]|jgi:hypothetical protein
MKKLGVTLIIVGSLMLAGGAAGITYHIVNHDDMVAKMQEQMQKDAPHEMGDHMRGGHMQGGMMR